MTVSSVYPLNIQSFEDIEIDETNTNISLMFHGSLSLCLLFLSKSCSPLSLSHACYFPSSLEGTVTRLVLSTHSNAKILKPHRKSCYGHMEYLCH